MSEYPETKPMIETGRMQREAVERITHGDGDFGEGEEREAALPVPATRDDALEAMRYAIERLPQSRMPQAAYRRIVEAFALLERAALPVPALDAEAGMRAAAATRRFHDVTWHVGCNGQCDAMRMTRAALGEDVKP